MSKYATQIDGRSQDGVLSVTCLHTKVVTENTHAPVLSNLMWLCSSFTIAHTLRMKAQAICTCSKENDSVF